MRITFCLPHIHNLPTGGNLYNRHIIGYLSGQADLDVKVVLQNSNGAVATGPETGTGPDSVNVVDSLLLETARPQSDGSQWILLVHALRLLDPSTSGTREAKKEESLLPLFDGFVATSEFSGDRLRSVGISGERVTVIRPGIDSRYRNSRLVSRGIDPCRLLTISNVLPGKGLIQFVGILEDIAPLPWTWDHVGDTSLSPGHGERFYDRVRRSSVRDRIRLHGSISPEELVALYDRSHLLVLPSKFESCSMATMEALSMGLPVIAYNVGGLPEVGGDGVRLVPTGDVSAFVDGLTGLIENRDERLDLSRKILSVGNKYASWEEVGEEFRRFVMGLRRGATVPQEKQ